MINAGVYLENQKDIVINALGTAKCRIVIAVAWINFDEYKNIINNLLQKNVKIRIVVNDDLKNKKYMQLVEEWEKNGLQFKMINMQKKYASMHCKFCVIDENMCIFGSYNWTKNANENNIENLIISYDKKLVDDFLFSFKTLWELSTNDFVSLRNPEYCEICKQPKAYLCVFIQEGYYQTKADIYEVCGCSDLKYVGNEFFDISVYSNLMGIFQKYSDMDEYDFENDLEINKHERKMALDSEVKNYLSNVRNDRMGFSIIHAVGIYGWKPIYKDDGKNIIKVLWKEIYSSNYVMDEYEII